MVSAQVKSALLLAALRASGTTTVALAGPEPRPHRAHAAEHGRAARPVDRWRRAYGFAGRPGRPTRRSKIRVPADFSSAAFFLVAGCLGARDGLLIENVGINPTRTALLAILREMGASIELRNQRSVGAEPVADLWVAQSELKGIAVPPELVPLAIDEFPILFIAAAAAAR